MKKAVPLNVSLRCKVTLVYQKGLCVHLQSLFSRVVSLALNESMHKPYKD